MRVIEAINAALHRQMEADARFHVVGEDIADPYGGAFKATRGLSDAFGARVMTTPISEAAIVGFATGMAMKGRPTCVEIMFGDFITLAFDQLVNHAAKLAWVYNDQITVPLVVRAPMGGKRGYGSTHSQSLEKHLCGVPGLGVYAVSEFSDVAALYAGRFAAPTPSVVIENKVLYAQRCRDAALLAPHAAPDLCIVTYGGSVGLALDAAERLWREDEVAVNVVAVERLSPFDHGDLRERVGGCRAVLAVEEGSEGWNFGSEVARALVGTATRFAAMAAPAHPIPSARPWELALLPDAAKVHEAAYRLLSH